MKKVEIEGILPQVMILDLNGTLVNSMGGAISPRIAELLEDISEHASMYVVSSYNSEMIKHILEDAGISPEIFSGFNGAVRLDTSDMELIDYLTSDFDLFARCTSKIQGMLNALAQEGIRKEEIRTC